MRSVLRAGLGAATLALLSLPALAQWQAAAGVSARQVTNCEYDKAGKQLVRDAGWLPGAVLDASYQAGRYTGFAGAEIVSGSVGYHGQTQAGAAAESTTSMHVAVVRLGGAFAFGGNYSAFAAIESETSARDIIGIAGAVGLQEKNRTWRLVAGAGKTWHPAGAGTVAMDAAVVLAEPERLQVGFSGLLDPAALRTSRSQGVRIGAGLRPAFAPWLQLRSRLDWIKVPRSGDVAVTRNGQFSGTIAEPQHEQRALSFTASAIF